MTIAEHNLADQDTNADLPPHPGRRMSEEEFANWSGDFWAEWIDGEVIIMMTVSRDHAFHHTFLFTLLTTYNRRHKTGAVFVEPFQVRLGPQRIRRSPDIFYISKERSDIVKKHVVDGPPNLIIEIVSPGSEARDWREKYHEYESAGVNEYWVVDPAHGHVEAYSLAQNRFERIKEEADRIASRVLPGLYIRPSWIKSMPLPDIDTVLLELGL